MSAVYPPNADRLAIRWTIGDVRDRGFEMLRLSLACAHRLFGPFAKYLVCVNTIAVATARARTGPLPFEPEWREVTRADVSQVFQPYFDNTLMEGMGWKLVPLRTCEDCYELAIDNDCILWDLPDAVRQWLESGNGSVFAEDVDRCLGSFDALCPPGAFNAGIRGLAPGQNLELPLQDVMQSVAIECGGQVQLLVEIEEQGLQAAAIHRLRPVLLVKTTEVSICSPFWPRSPDLGTCGAHFVGMNAQHTPWNYYDRPADSWLEEHWQRHRPALYRIAGLSM